jgi:5-methylthioadenosine/S-adenosylhomocysteine deaminase
MPKSRFLIAGGTVLPMAGSVPVRDGASVLIEDQTISAVFDAGHDVSTIDAERIDAAGSFVLPGFVDTHRHTWQSLFRGIAADWRIPEYLEGFHHALSPLFEPGDTYLGNLLGATDALDSGITTVVDYSHNLSTPDHADAAVHALMESGIRAVFAHADGAPAMVSFPSAVAHTVDARRVRERYFASDNQLVTFAMGLRGVQFATEEVCQLDWSLARDLDAHILTHVGDGEWNRGRPVETMERLGLTGPDVTYVHCNKTTDDELRIIARTGGGASTSAAVEAQMGYGPSAIGRLVAAGVEPSLSSDIASSFASDMFSLMKTSLVLERLQENGVALTTWDILRFATAGGARAVGLGDRTGTLEAGKQADVILVRYCDPAMSAAGNNPAAALVYGGHPGLVDTVFVAGHPVKRNGVLLDLDPVSILERSNTARDKIIRRGQRSRTLPHAVLGGLWHPEGYRPAED